MLTYEPQWNSDVNSVYENIVSGEVYPPRMLDEELPEGQKSKDDVIALMDWEKNIDPHYRKHYFRRPIVEVETDAYISRWITYANPYIAAKELTVKPGKSVMIADGAAYVITPHESHIIKV